MRVTRTDDGFRLEKPTGEIFNLTTDEALELIPIARQMQHQVRSQRPETEPSQVFSYAVRDITLSLDAHHSEVVMLFLGTDGLEIGYTISLAVAKFVRDGLTRKIEQIEASGGQTRQ